MVFFWRQCMLCASMNVYLLEFNNTTYLCFNCLARLFCLEKCYCIIDLSDLPNLINFEVCWSDVFWNVCRIFLCLSVHNLSIPPEKALGRVTHGEIEIFSNHFTMCFFALGSHFVHYSLAWHNALAGICVACK